MKKIFNENEGVWRTISGRRVFIREGQSLSDAMKESGKFKTQFKKEKTNKYIEKNKKLEEMKKTVNEQYEKDIMDARITGNDKLEESAKNARIEQLRDIDRMQKENTYEYNLYKQAMENPDSIDPMTENSTDWEALDKKYGDRYKKERNIYESKVYGKDVTELDRNMKEAGIEFRYSEEEARARLEQLKKEGKVDGTGTKAIDRETQKEVNRLYLDTHRFAGEELYSDDPNRYGDKLRKTNDFYLKEQEESRKRVEERYKQSQYEEMANKVDEEKAEATKPMLYIGQDNKYHIMGNYDYPKNREEYHSYLTNKYGTYKEEDIVKNKNGKTSYKEIRNTYYNDKKRYYEYMAQHPDSEISFTDFKKWYK